MCYLILVFILLYYMGLLYYFFFFDAANLLIFFNTMFLYEIKYIIDGEQHTIDDIFILKVMG